MFFEIQRASLLKRISAFILDMILLTVVVTGAMFAMSAIVGYDDYANRYSAYADEYSEKHQIEKSLLEVSTEDYNKFSDDEQKRFDTAWNEFWSDERVVYDYSMMNNLIVLITSLGIFFGYAVTEFAIPLILKNGQTVGKKVFSLGVIRCDGVKMNTFMLFVRTLLGKFTVETMVPVMLLVMNGVFGLAGLAVVGLLLIFELVLLFATKNRMVIHDAFAQTVVVDLPSQMIFETPEELLAYKERVASEAAARAEYR